VPDPEPLLVPEPDPERFPYPEPDRVPDPEPLLVPEPDRVPELLLVPEEDLDMSPEEPAEPVEPDVGHFEESVTRLSQVPVTSWSSLDSPQVLVSTHQPQNGSLLQDEQLVYPLHWALRHVL